ncbi:hypothetical protein AB4Z22_27080 [Paenibacillus sp. TAF58]
MFYIVTGVTARLSHAVTMFYIVTEDTATTVACYNDALHRYRRHSRASRVL